jgi:tetratricopeptide (TPR) repeat protein
MTVFRGIGRGAAEALGRLGMRAVLLALLAIPATAIAQDRAQLLVGEENGFARMILSFPQRLDFPAYRLNAENGVLAIEFEEPVSLLLPDVPLALPNYVAASRLDPDGRGLRFGLRTTFNVNPMEAGEKLFIDLLPVGWQGLPPALPDEVIADLAQRAKNAAILAEQRRKAEEAKGLRPVAGVRVGRNPTFLRVQFDWSVDTKAAFELDGETGNLVFDWPVPVDLADLRADLPPEILEISNEVKPDGSHVVFRVTEGTAPRFYATSARQFVVDIDIDREAGLAAAIAADEAKAERAAALRAALAEAEQKVGAETAPEAAAPSDAAEAPRAVVPVVSEIGATVRVSFPFDQETAAAVFRRGDTLWMLFDTTATIQPPAASPALDAIASGFAVVPAGATQVVRLDLAGERLASLGSEGRSWVLSLGDVLLNPTEPLALERQRNVRGHYSMAAALERPGSVHQFRDPVVGDVLSVVTAFPPARGVARSLEYVDFQALRSIQGLVIRPENPALKVALDAETVVIDVEDGLTLSAADQARSLDAGNAAEFRNSYIDLRNPREPDPAELMKRQTAIITRATEAEGRLRDLARLELAQFYIANRFAHEAIGVLEVLAAELRSPDLEKQARLSRGIADTLAGRPAEALVILGAQRFSEETDALMWRTIAKVDALDFNGARTDALAAEAVVDSYPDWVRNRFLLAGARAAVETRDYAMALRYIDFVDFAALDLEQVGIYQMLQGRVAEAEERYHEALEIYGQVIAADIRPSRAEAVYRTLSLLDRTGRLDVAKAATTLAAEAMMWRGDWLEAEMQSLLADLYFRSGEYRSGFETVKQAAARFPASAPVTDMVAQAQAVFIDLYLNGRADEMEPVAALGVYYDFQQLTPPGARGDEMIRNLARRLVKVDLLTQAGDLLEYQIDSRLNGVAQAQIATDLAVIRIADRDPRGALDALNSTRLADLPPTLQRQRRVLEARALLDAGREELAIDLLTRVEGRDADQLRVDGLWKLKRYGEAAELLERMHAPNDGQLLQKAEARMNIIKAAAGFVMANDRLGLSRLRSKYGEQMARSAEWAMFDFVTGDTTPTSAEFREVAREVSGLDSLNAFLSSYREIYAGSGTMAPEKAAQADA